MNTNIVIPWPVSHIRVCLRWSATAVCSVFLLLVSEGVFAAESASFLLYDSFPNVSDTSPSDSDSFVLDESGVTWVAQPVASTSFQIVTSPPVVASSSLSSTSSAEASSESSAPPASGGRRGSGPLAPSRPSDGSGTPGGSIPVLQPTPSVPLPGIQPIEGIPSSGFHESPSTFEVPPHHYRQPVAPVHSVAPQRKPQPLQRAHYRQCFMSVFAQDMFTTEADDIFCTLPIGLAVGLLQLFIVLFAIRSHRRFAQITRCRR